jgi:hypothetical protein
VKPPPAKQPDVVVLRHVRAKYSRNSKGVIVPELPCRLTPEQERDRASRAPGITIRK